MKKNLKVIMLAAKSSEIILITEGKFAGQLAHSDNYGRSMTKMGDEYQHLYFISDETPKQGELCYSIRGFIGYFGRFENSYENECKKLIGSSDKKLTPYEWIPKSFIKAFIKSYNEKTPIKEVSVDYFNYENSMVDSDGYVPLEGFGKIHINNFPLPKRRKDWSLIINHSETFTKDEMFLNMQYYMEYCQREGYITPQDWLENHKHF